MNYYDRNGKHLTVYEWMELFEDPHYKRVRIDVVGEFTISTVWLGIDHNYSESGPPLIFETMIFSNNDVELGQYRYSTEAEAIEGHNLVVNRMGMQQ